MAGAVNGDYRLLAGSVCIDGGDPGFVCSAGEVDIYGNARIIYGGVDIGACEFGVLGDTDKDCDVDAHDLATLALRWLESDPDISAADFDRDGIVGLGDFDILAENYYRP
jgi:hypothetical protein